jgi:hypothetical protein
MEASMSYSIQLEVRDNVVTVKGQTNEVPDGQYSVNGHESDRERTISVAQYAPPGPAGEITLLASASAAVLVPKPAEQSAGA